MVVGGFTSIEYAEKELVSYDSNSDFSLDGGETCSSHYCSPRCSLQEIVVIQAYSLLCLIAESCS